jgi:type VI protein secretion system component VasF
LAEIRQLHDQERKGRAASAALLPSKRLLPANDNRPPLRLVILRLAVFALLGVLAAGLLGHQLGLL